jgi:hypothetical protein
MPTAPQQNDPRREQLRRQAIQRRQAVLDRLSGIRLVAVGLVVLVSCILAGYLDASARPHHSMGLTVSGGTGSGLGLGGGSSAANSSGGSGTATAGSGGGSGQSLSGGGSGQSLSGGGSPPVASSGGGSVISGGS